MKKFFLFFVLVQSLSPAPAQKSKSFQISSPDSKFLISINAGEKITWSVKHGQQTVIIPSAVSIQLNNGPVLGKNVQITSSKQEAINETFDAVNYKKDKVENKCNQLTLACKGDYGIIFRAYNDGVAYRFFTRKKDELVIRSEQAEFNFDKNYTTFIPLTSDLREGEKYSCSFEEFYAETPVSKINKDTLGYLPLLVELDNNKKAVLLEADVQDYPGMFVQLNQQTPYGIRGVFAPYPIEEAIGVRSKLNYMVKKRAGYIAKVNGTRNFPWRVIVVSEQDKDLLNNDMV